jgi:hypothetical protein
MGMSCSAWLLVVLDCGFEIVVDLDRQASRVEAGMAKWDSWDKLNRQKKVSKFDYLEEREAKASKSGSSTYYHPRSAKYKRARPKPNSYVQPSTLGMLAGESPASAMDGWAE